MLSVHIANTQLAYPGASFYCQICQLYYPKSPLPTIAEMALLKYNFVTSLAVKNIWLENSAVM